MLRGAIRGHRSRVASTRSTEPQSGLTPKTPSTEATRKSAKGGCAMKKRTLAIGILVTVAAGVGLALSTGIRRRILDAVQPAPTA